MHPLNLKFNGSFVPPLNPCWSESELHVKLHSLLMASSDHISDTRFEGEVYHGYQEIAVDYFTPEEIDQLKSEKLVEASPSGCLRLAQGEATLFDDSFEPNHYEQYFLWRFRHLSLTAIIETETGDRIVRQLNGCNQLLALNLPDNSANIFIQEPTKEDRDQQLNCLRTPEDLISWLLDYSHLNIVECYSTPVYEKRKFEEAEFVKRFSDVHLTLLIDDSDYESGSRHITSHSMDAAAMIQVLREGEYTNTLSLSEFQTLSDLRQGLLETSRFVVGCIPTDQWQKRQADEQRQQYEIFAAEIVQRHNCKPYSLEFLDAIQAEKSQWQDMKYGLREDGLCAGDGTIASWYDLNDGHTENIDRVTQLQHWIEKNLPLLWAQWQEAQASQAHSASV